SSVTIGFRVTPELKNIIRFVDDPTISITVVNDEPINSKAEQEKTEREAALDHLIAEMKKA
ncbi:MAG: hypothetical protein KDJ52_19035, partial [Anaerolineae bacterium]|nr:hypothetical protein [Anaerolineae bacterium]